MRTARLYRFLPITAALFWLVLVTGFGPATAHGPLEEQLEALTRQIATHPEDAELHLRRGELHRLDRDWSAARADFDRAERLDPARAETQLCRGALALDTGDLDAALRALDLFVAKRPDHTDGLWLRSRALRVAGRPEAAVADMDRAIALLAAPRPDHFLERARTQVAAGTSDLDVVLRDVDAGLERLGPIVSLDLYAIDLEIEAGRFDAARARIARVEKQTGPQTAKRAQLEAAASECTQPAGSERISLTAPAGSRPATVPPIARQPSVVAAAPAARASMPTATSTVPQLDSGAASILGSGERDIAATLTRAPYLQLGTPTSVVLRWRTSPASNSRVRYGTSPANPTVIVDHAVETTEHEMTITGLAPDTRYYYSVGSSTETLAGGDGNHFFVTSPNPGQPKPTRIWVLGDSGLPGAQQNAVRDAYLAFTGPYATDVLLMLGDNAYNSGTDLEYQAGLFTPYTNQLRQMFLWPTRGNHDAVFAGPNNDYYDLFTMPTAAQAGGVASGTEAYYSFDHGNIHFVCLDSEGSDRSPNGAMLTWLRNDLTANDQDWTIAYWHHPPYTKGSHNSDNVSDSGGRMRDMRTNAVPILDSLGVDVALTGHSHSYERSFLLDRHYGLSTTLTGAMILDGGSGNPNTDGYYAKPTLGPAFHEGAVHAVAGSSSHTSGGTLNHPAMYTSQNILGSMVLDIEGPRLTARFLDEVGAVRDFFQIFKGPGQPTGTETMVRVDLQLEPLRPNPFRERTRVSFSLPGRGAVRLTIHDAAGRRVATIVEEEHAAGVHSVDWNGRDPSGNRVAAGVYFARLEFAGKARHGKVVLTQ